MTRDEATSAGECGRGARPAETEALASVIAVAAAMADRAGSEAASALLVRALSLVRERMRPPSDRSVGDEAAPEPDGFRPP